MPTPAVSVTVIVFSLSSTMFTIPSLCQPLPPLVTDDGAWRWLIVVTIGSASESASTVTVAFCTAPLYAPHVMST